MKKDILAVVDIATRFTKQFFLLFRKGVSLIWLYQNFMALAVIFLQTLQMNKQKRQTLVLVSVFLLQLAIAVLSESITHRMTNPSNGDGISQAPSLSTATICIGFLRFWYQFEARLKPFSSYTKIIKIRCILMMKKTPN